MNIIALSGSLRAGSFNTQLLNCAIDLAPEGLVIQVITLNDIPLYNGDNDTPDTKPQSVLDLAEKLRAADGILISTPEYNYSMSGVLKNTIDWMSRVKDQPFNAKPVAIVGASAGQLGTVRAQIHLRQVLACLNARVMSRPEFLMGAAHTKFSPEGKLNDADSEKFLTACLTEFESWVAGQAQA